MLETLSKIQNFYYGVNEGCSRLIAQSNDTEREKSAMSAASTVDDGLTTRDGEPEDVV